MKMSGNVHTMRAPTMQGMQQVNTWNLLQIVPVRVNSNTYNPDEPASVQIVSGVNRWAWELRQNGALQSGESLAYGEATEQFSELAALWATYRLDGIEITYVPSQTGAGQQTATVSAIDPAGESVNLSIGDALVDLSRLRTVQLTDARNPCVRKLDYRNWISQCAPQPFLQTIDLTVGTGVRELYPSGTNNVAPVVRMAFQTTPGVQVTNSLVLGFFRINARYSVRGRRSQVLSPNMRLQLMTPREREETFALLVKKYGQSYAMSKLDMPVPTMQQLMPDQFSSASGRMVQPSNQAFKQ